MLASLCFNRAADSASVLQLGLGAGAINRFFDHYFPQQQLTTVELEPVVVDIYKAFFCFENKAAKTQQRIIVENALSYLSAAEENSSDLILCDLYTEQGLPDFLLEQQFYQSVYRVLSADGVLVINTGHRSAELLQRMFNPLREFFTYLVFSELVGYENIIIYASNTELSIDQSKCDQLQKSIDLNIYQHFSSAKTLAI
jgi:spermidine synthase